MSQIRYEVRNREGARIAFEELYDEHFDGIFRYILYRVGQVAEAEDLTAQTFFKALRSLWRFRWSKGSFSAWLYRIATNEVNSHHRRRRLSVPLNLLDAGEPQEYIRDVAAEAAYGIVAKVYENSSIEDAAELLTEAQYILSLYKEPEITYSIDLVDLSKDKNYKRDFEHVELGARVLVIDDKLGISTEQEVTRLVHNLDLPFNLAVSLSSISRIQGGRKSITDVVKWLMDKVDDFALSDDTQVPLSDTAPVVFTDTGAAGTALEAARQDHVHPGLSNTNPVALGAAAPGAGATASRFNHVHPYEVYT